MRGRAVQSVQGLQTAWTVGNANFAWVQHMIHHLAPTGYAGFVLANGSMSSNQSGEGEIRKNIIEADLVDCMVALPGQLFYSTQIPACLERTARTYHAWRGEKHAGEYEDVPGFCKSATLEEIRKHGHVLTPGRYVGAEKQEDDGEPFEEKTARLTRELSTQLSEAARLGVEIRKDLAQPGFPVEKG